MTTTITIPPRTVAAGSATLGPFAVATGLAEAELALDIANLTPSLSLSLDYAGDGVTFENLGSITADGPGRDRAGNPAPTLHWLVTLGNDPNGPKRTSASARVRLAVTNATAFASAGGSLVVR